MATKSTTNDSFKFDESNKTTDTTNNVVDTQPNKEDFMCLPATNKTAEVCINCLDRPQMKDDEAECCHYRGEPFCAHCSCLWFPFAFTFDIVSCPFRGIKHYFC